MPEKKSWEERYLTGDLPWDSNKPDFNLTKLVATGEIKLGKAFEIGCGTGTNSVWLTKNGFTAEGIDISEKAVQLATERAAKERVNCSFIHMDFLEGEIEGAPFDLIYDRGCFHSIDLDPSKKTFVQKIAASLKPGGKWLSIMGSADDAPREVGPPRLTVKEIGTFVEPCFEILSLTASHFEDDAKDSPRAFVCLMKKRKAP